MSTLRLVRAYQRWRDQGVTLTLATAIECAGSTYSKPGARLVIPTNGEYQGLLSGGCLENDLIIHARRVMETDTPAVVSYDMRDRDDELWGLGSGCNGKLSVFLQPVRPGDDYQPLETMAERALSGHRTTTATIVKSGNARVPVGTTLVLDRDTTSNARLDHRTHRRLLAVCREYTDVDTARLIGIEIDETDVTIHLATLAPVPRLLVLGAGPDALPLIAMADELGWLVTLCDHRPAYIAAADASNAKRIPLEAPETLETHVELSRYAAALVMSHHLETDRRYLEILARSNLKYIGLLGPAARRQRLLDDLHLDTAAFNDRLHGPVGLDIGANSPESIALSALSEIHAVLYRGSGRSLSTGRSLHA